MYKTALSFDMADKQRQPKMKLHWNSKCQYIQQDILCGVILTSLTSVLSFG